MGAALGALISCKYGISFARLKPSAIHDVLIPEDF
jgi:hypothetical protein